MSLVDALIELKSFLAYKLWFSSGKLIKFGMLTSERTNPVRDFLLEIMASLDS